MSVAGRDCARVYRVQDRADVHRFVVDAVARSGGHVLYASEATRAPVFLGVLTPRQEPVGLLVYPFRMTQVTTRNRPTGEVRGQIRYGGEQSWAADDHWVGRDVAGVDTTLVLGVHLDDGVLVGLDPDLYDPLPMGISFYARDTQMTAARATSWHVWERDNHPGTRRTAPRALGGLETLVAFTPDRLLDYARLERQATGLSLDGPLRFAAAQQAATPVAGVPVGGAHQLERDFGLSSAEILDIIATRTRLAVAVRGGVAEHHLERVLRADPAVAAVARLDQDAQHDFDVTLTGGRQIRVECKNVSPDRYADGVFRVEVQKTRASLGDTASRFYRVDQFDVVAACLYAPTRTWEFRYRATDRLLRHPRFPERLAALQRVDQAWAVTLADTDPTGVGI